MISIKTKFVIGQSIQWFIIFAWIVLLGLGLFSLKILLLTIPIVLALDHYYPKVNVCFRTSGRAYKLADGFFLAYIVVFVVLDIVLSLPENINTILLSDLRI